MLDEKWVYAIYSFFINFLSEVTTGIFLCFFFYLFWGQLHFLSYFTVIFSFCGLASLVAQLAKNPPAVWETWVWSLGWKDPLEKFRKVYPLQYSGLENSMDCIIHGVAKNWTQLSNFYFQPPRALEIEPDNIKSERTDTWIYKNTSIN